MSSTSHSAARSSTRFKRLRLGVAVFGVVIILGFAGSSAYDVWRSYGQALTATDREIGNVAHALAEQTAWTWQGLDLLLRDTADWYMNDSHEIPREQIDAALGTRTAGVPQVRLVTIVDAQGLQRHRSRGHSPPNLNVADRSYFIAQRDRTVTGAFMSEPIVTRSEDRAGVVLSRRLDDDKGGFAGVVTAIVDLEDVQHFYRAVNLGKGSAIHLLRDNGALLVRNPPVADAVGLNFPALAAIPASGATRLVQPNRRPAGFYRRRAGARHAFEARSHARRERGIATVARRGNPSGPAHDHRHVIRRVGHRGAAAPAATHRVRR